MADGQFVSIKSGDCISSIAEEYGLWWKSIWYNPKNQTLRQARKDPNVLLPGDKVYIPKFDEKQWEGPTETRHRFRRRGVPAKLCIRLLVEHQPVSDTPYNIAIDGVWRDGKTNDKGDVIETIPPKAREALILVEHEGEKLEFEFRLGRLDPEHTLLGIQQRLNNLGYGAGEEDGILGLFTRKALLRFQLDHELEETGEPDDATINTLREAHEDGTQNKIKPQEKPSSDNTGEDWIIVEDEDYPERGVDVETLPDDFDPEEEEGLDDGYEKGEQDEEDDDEEEEDEEDEYGDDALIDEDDVEFDEDEDEYDEDEDKYYEYDEDEAYQKNG